MNDIIELEAAAPEVHSEIQAVLDEMQSDAIMPKIIGQNVAKAQVRQRILSFFRTKGFLAPILFEAPRGYGKTCFVRSMGKRLVSQVTGEPKPFVEITGGTLKSVGALIDAIGKYLAGPDGGSQEVTVFIDEIHAADKKVRDFLLSFISPSAEGRSRVLHNGQEFEVDFRFLTFFMATTDSDKLSEAFKSRCNRIVLNLYTKSEMKQILDQYLDSMAKLHGLPRPTVSEEVAEDLVSICRRTPRFAVKRADDLVQFCANENTTKLGRKEFRKYVKAFDIHPCGLNANEIRVLQALQDGGAMTLNALVGRTALEKRMIQQDCETILHENGLIIIDGKRSITGKGRDVLRGWE
jgi:Holliday junction DNA helicase RuvB